MSNKRTPWWIGASGNKYWENEAGELHREDGPAIEGPNGDKEWFFNAKYHREDGPAVIWADGTEEWYLNGRELDPLEIFLIKSTLPSK